jgi:hypothetical protein
MQLGEIPLTEWSIVQQCRKNLMEKIIICEKSLHTNIVYDAAHFQLEMSLSTTRIIFTVTSNRSDDYSTGFIRDEACTRR